MSFNACELQWALEIESRVQMTTSSVKARSWLHSCAQEINLHTDRSLIIIILRVNINIATINGL